MKKFLVFVLFFVFVVSNAFGSPLIFRVKKEITTTGVAELASFDATKYRQIRIGVKVSNLEKSVSKIAAETELSSAKEELQRKENLLASGDITRSTFDLSLERVRIAQRIYDSTKEYSSTSVNIFGVENGDEILLAVLELGNVARSVVIDSPSSKISVKVAGKGTYSLYIWGQ